MYLFQIISACFCVALLPSPSFSLTEETLITTELQNLAEQSNSTGAKSCTILGEIVRIYNYRNLRFNWLGSSDFDLEFWLMLEGNRKLKMKICDPTMPEEFDITRPTVFIIHGYMSNSKENWVESMADAFNKKQNVNVIAVDWSDGSDAWVYNLSAMNVQRTAEKMKIFVNAMIRKVQKQNIPETAWQPIHCVGHSLGAHVCGFFAKQMRSDVEVPKSFHVARISGLDPADPCFFDRPADERLDKSDAPFVDIIHTNTHLHKAMGFGFPKPLGHMDFYPNGGHSQYGCDQQLITDNTFLNYVKRFVLKLYDVITNWTCSHGQAYVFFTQSLLMSREEQFSSFRWNRTVTDAIKLIDGEKCNPSYDKGCVEMGYFSYKYEERGVFFLTTSNSTPFYEPNSFDKEMIKKSILDNNEDLAS